MALKKRAGAYGQCRHDSEQPHPTPTHKVLREKIVSTRRRFLKPAYLFEIENPFQIFDMFAHVFLY
jgi:hypothetical protein